MAPARHCSRDDAARADRLAPGDVDRIVGEEHGVEGAAAVGAAGVSRDVHVSQEPRRGVLRHGNSRRRPIRSLDRRDRRRRPVTSVAVGELVALELAGAAQVLEVGERLAVGHRTLRPRREQVRRQLLHAGRAAELLGRAAQQVEALDVVLLDRLGPAGEVVERVAVGRAARSTTSGRTRRPCRATRRSRAAGRRCGSKPPMCGVIVGSTWSPESITPSVGSNRQRWSSVWPGVCRPTHSRPASVIDLGVGDADASVSAS